jgi:hypothetical protein
MKTFDAAKVVGAAVIAMLVILVMAVARALILFKVLFGVTLALLAIVVTVGSRGVLRSKKLA